MPAAPRMVNWSIAEQLSAGRLGAPRARVLERLGSASDPGAISLLAIAAYDIPTEFPAAAIAEAEAALPVTPDRARRSARNPAGHDRRQRCA